MNKTKRKIFETSMKLFAEKGYDATSIEEITSVVGVAKGTLYYHFSSKEEIFEFLVEEGVKLLKNSIEIKTEGLDKVRAKTTPPAIPSGILCKVTASIIINVFLNLFTLPLSHQEDIK